jgi:hypothetical protein
MRLTALALVSASFLAPALPAADPQLVNMVMPEAKVIAGINIDSARNSPFGTFLLQQASENNGELQKFVQATGFNPQTDLHEILVASPGVPTPPADATALAAGGKIAASPDIHGLILARGNFNVEKISALAKTDGKQHIEAYKGATLILDPNNGTASAMAFVSSNIVVAGDIASVKAALDRRNIPSPLDVQLSTKVNSLSSSQDAWAVSIAPLSSLNAGPATDPTLQGALGGDLFKKITQTSGGIKFGSQIQLFTELVAMDEKNATSLGDVVKFLVGMATMNAGSPKGNPPVIVSLLQSLTVQTQGNVVNVSVSVPEDQLESLLTSMKSGTAPGAKI